MHLIHIADTHLGLAAFNRLDPESGMNLREKQVYDNFLKAIDEIIHKNPTCSSMQATSSMLSNPRPGHIQPCSKRSTGFMLPASRLS